MSYKRILDSLLSFEENCEYSLEKLQTKEQLTSITPKCACPRVMASNSTLAWASTCLFQEAISFLIESCNALWMEIRLLYIFHSILSLKFQKEDYNESKVQMCLVLVPSKNVLFSCWPRYLQTQQFLCMLEYVLDTESLLLGVPLICMWSIVCHHTRTIAEATSNPSF